MRSIILSEKDLLSAITAAIHNTDTDTLRDKIIEGACDILDKRCCADMAEKLKEAIDDADYGLPERPDAAAICDAILDQAQRVGVVSEVL
jgi:hypothetical protein